MLLESYKANGLIWLSNVSGLAGDQIEAFRGDLVIEFGDMHEASQTRNPPKKMIEQVVLLADGGKITFFAGFIEDLHTLQPFAARYAGDFADGATAIIYCVNIEEPMKVTLDGVTFTCIPMSEGLVWNELMDRLYIEKSDLKGQSPEQKIITVAAARGELSFKGETLDFVAASAKTNAAVREFSGAI